MPRLPASRLLALLLLALAVSWLTLPAGSRAELPGLTRRAYLPALSAESTSQGSVTRILRVGAVTNTSTHPVATFTGTAAGAAFSVTIFANGLASTTNSLSVTTGATYATAATPPEGWAIVGFAAVPDPDGSAACAATLSYFPTSLIPSGGRYLVCVLYSFTAPSTVRGIRVEKVTTTTIHPDGAFVIHFEPITPSGGFLYGAPSPQDVSVTLSANLLAGLDGVASLSRDGWAISETIMPPNWRLDGFAILPDPAGTASCASAPIYSLIASATQIPSDAQSYLVCVKNTYLDPATSRQLRIGKVTASAGHPGGSFSGMTTTGAGFGLTLAAGAGASSMITITVEQSAMTLSELAMTTGWSYQGATVLPDTDPTRQCSISVGGFVAGPAVIPSGATPYLVCLNNAYVTAPRTIRVGIATDTQSHPPDSIFQLSSGSLGNLYFGLAINAPASTVQEVSTASQNVIVTATTWPANWALAGYAIFLEPSGYGSCPSTGPYSMIQGSGTVPPGQSSYLVCVLFRYTQP